jgi:hypothetical protein
MGDRMNTRASPPVSAEDAKARRAEKERVDREKKKKKAEEDQARERQRKVVEEEKRERERERREKAAREEKERTQKEKERNERLAREKEEKEKERSEREEREGKKRADDAFEAEKIRQRQADEDEQWKEREDEALEEDRRRNEEESRKRSGEEDVSGTIYVDDIEDDADFQIGRSAFLSLSEAAGKSSSARGESRIQQAFIRNASEANFKDGHLVGAMFFHSGVPAVGEIQSTLTKMGLGGTITPITRGATESRNFEIRVWDKANANGVHKTIVRRGSELALAGDKPFRWKDLRLIDTAVVKVTGLPFQWQEKEVRCGVFKSLGFPVHGLQKIIRIAFNGKPSGEVQLIYEFVPERIISWGRLARNEFKCSKTKTAAWRMAYPPREYDAFVMCEYCNWNHSGRVDCEVKLAYNNSGNWMAVEELLTEDGREDSLLDEVPYLIENFGQYEYNPPVKESRRGGGRGGRGGDRGGRGGAPGRDK